MIQNITQTNPAVELQYSQQGMIMRMVEMSNPGEDNERDMMVSAERSVSCINNSNMFGASCQFKQDCWFGWE